MDTSAIETLIETKVHSRLIKLGSPFRSDTFPFFRSLSVENIIQIIFNSRTSLNLANNCSRLCPKSVNFLYN